MIKQRRKKPVNGFKKGVSGNPNGGPKTPPSVKAIREENIILFMDLIHSAMSMTPEQLQTKSNDNKVTMREAMIYRAVFEAVQGNIAYFKELLDRFLGKANISVDIEGMFNNNVKVTAEVQINNAIKLLNDKTKKRTKAK